MMVMEDWDPGITVVRSSDTDENQGEDFWVGRWGYFSYHKGFDLGASGYYDGLRKFWKQDLSNAILALIKARVQKEEGSGTW